MLRYFHFNTDFVVVVVKKSSIPPYLAIVYVGGSRDIHVDVVLDELLWRICDSMRCVHGHDYKWGVSELKGIDVLADTEFVC